MVICHDKIAPFGIYTVNYIGPSYFFATQPNSICFYLTLVQTYNVTTEEKLFPFFSSLGSIKFKMAAIYTNIYKK